MKVLYLVPQPKRPERIAAYTFLDEEIQALASAGIDAYVLSTAAPADAWCGRVHLISTDARRSLARRLGAAALVARSGHASLSHASEPVVWYRSAWREYVAARVVVEERIDLIHSHFAWPSGSGGMLAKAATGRPLVACLRGTDIVVNSEIKYGRRQGRFFDGAVRRLVRSADTTLYFSNYMRDHGLALGADPGRARVIRKGVDLSRFGIASNREALRDELGFGRRPMILTVAGLIPLKGIHHILEALGQLRDRDFTFVVCGEGPERARLEALSARLGLGDRTRFVGRVDRATIPRYFAACDMLVLASITEAAGNVLFEAMSSGRPVVCTSSGGPQEYVVDGETGFVVPVGDVDAMTRRIRLLLERPALQEQIGREAHRRAVSELSYDRMVADVIEVYEDMLRTHSSEPLAV
jgi:glycosyltransferase involved in cell wall biosynthesis